jgi:hypothetical protein
VAEDKAVSQEQVKQIAKRALSLEQYILRRAWGLCYAVFAVEIALIVSFDILFGIARLSPDYKLIVPLAFNSAISIFGAAVAAWVFKKAYAAMLVRREIVDSVWTKLLRPRWIAAVWLVYYLPVAFAIVFLRPIAGDVLYGILAASVAPFYFSLKVSFPERLPREGIAVLATFAFCALGNLTVFLLRGTPAPLLWVLMVAVLLIAAAYVYRQKPPKAPEEPEK